jgi:hypothetical protein
MSAWPSSCRKASLAGSAASRSTAAQPPSACPDNKASKRIKGIRDRATSHLRRISCVTQRATRPRRRRARCAPHTVMRAHGRARAARQQRRWRRRRRRRRRRQLELSLARHCPLARAPGCAACPVVLHERTAAAARPRAARRRRGVAAAALRRTPQQRPPRGSRARAALPLTRRCHGRCLVPTRCRRAGRSGAAARLESAAPVAAHAAAPHSACARFILPPPR